MLNRKGDADLFDAEIRRRRQLGPALALELAREAITLDQFVRSGFRAHAATLSSPSRAKYAWALEHHLSELVDEQLRTTDVPRIVAPQHHLLETGRSPATVGGADLPLSRPDRSRGGAPARALAGTAHCDLRARDRRAEGRRFDGFEELISRTRAELVFRPSSVAAGEDH